MTDKENENEFEGWWENDFEYTPGEGVYNAIKKAYLAGRRRGLEESYNQCFTLLNYITFKGLRKEFEEWTK